MTKKIKYQSEFELKDSEIHCHDRESFEDRGLIEIYSDHTHKSKFYFRLSRVDKNNYLTATSIIYEATFSQEQDVYEFHKAAKEKVVKYLEFLKFRWGELSIEIDNEFILMPQFVVYGGRSGCTIGFRGSVVSHSVEKLAEFSTKGMEAVVENRFLQINEYIERINSVSQIEDAVFKLISLVALSEYIEDTAIDLGFFRNPQKIDELKWAWAVRNLVAHGVVNRKGSVDALNEKMGISQNKFYFDRNTHLEIVREAASTYTRSIRGFVEHLLTMSHNDHQSD